MIVGLIPARSGSKGIEDKNIKPLGGYPLMAWSIVVSKACCGHTVVSTDSEEYARIAMTYGAEVVMRPSYLASDTSTDYDYLWHTLQEFPATMCFVLLRPTTPFREVRQVKKAISLVIDNWTLITGLRSVEQLSEPVEKMLRINNQGSLEGINKQPVDMANLPRQFWSPSYKANGYVDIVKANSLSVTNKRVFGKSVLPFITTRVPEIDTQEDWDYAEWWLERYGCPSISLLEDTTRARA